MAGSTPLSSELERLVEQAIAAREAAYAPYSNFLVGAALLTASGQTFLGCNVENASYGLSICAERTALCSAVAAGETEFRAIAVSATPLASPCGACRQFLAEFGLDICVICVDANNPSQRNIWTSGELLPSSFSFSKPAADDQ